MLIRCSGYNSGAQEYLEEGNKAGREYTRDELDERVILDGDLDLTRLVYESIPDKGQDRYLSFTMAFREDNVSYDALFDVTQEFKQFLMYAYKAEEFNFYAEAHIPKLKQIKDKATGEMIDRKPHIHIIIPKKNMLSSRVFDPVGSNYAQSEKFLEAFQEYINQKYSFASPREHVRVDPKDAASVLSRYKGDDFYGKNREFKQDLVKQIIAGDVKSRDGFYSLVASHGETRIRNESKPNEYIAVKLPGDAKFTNLKDTIFQDDFIVRRELKKPPLGKDIIQERLLEWPQRAKEIKYISKATPSFRLLFKQSSVVEKTQLLAEREQAFYEKYGDPYDLHTIERQGNHQRSADEAGAQRSAEVTRGLQDVPVSDLAAHRQAGSTGGPDSAVLLPGHAHLHLGQSEPGGDFGLRPVVRTGRGQGRGEQPNGRSGRPTAVPEAAGRHADAGSVPGAGRRRVRASAGLVIPPYARNPHRIATVADIEARGRRLFDPLKRPVDSALEITLAAAVAPGGAGPPESQSPDSAPSAVAPKRQRKPRNTSNNRNIPPYALNPRRVPTIADIEARGKRLFDPLKQPVDSALVMKLAASKPVVANRSASTVAAYFNRQIEHNQLLPAQRKAVQRADRQFFELRRLVFSDERLTPKDKTQLASVLNFERMKAREAIHTPLLNKEISYMGSAEIRALIDEDLKEEVYPQFSISGPGPRQMPPVRERIQRVISKMTWQVDGSLSKERERELSSKDIYTKKARFSQNVHYLDKTTDKTLFVDTGKSIAMRRNGITEAGIGVALQLATQRFGSSLTINGSADFKRLVVEAAAKSNMDVHFTDKAMNQALTLRRAELTIEREGQEIQAPDAPVREQAGPESPDQTAPAERSEPVVIDKSLIVGELIDHGTAPYKHDEKNEGSYFVSVQTETGPRTLWGVGLQEVMQENGFANGDRITLKDEGKQPVTIQQRQEDGSVKDTPGFRRAWSAEPETTGRVEPSVVDRAPVKAASEPITIVHNGEPLTVDPSNSSDVAKYTRQLTNEVNVQTSGIANATQRIGELVNMRDNHSASRGPEFIEQCNSEIAMAERGIEGSKAIVEQAETSLQALGSIPSQLDVSSAPDDAAGPELKPTSHSELVTPEEDQGPEMD